MVSHLDQTLTQWTLTSTWHILSRACQSFAPVFACQIFLISLYRMLDWQSEKWTYIILEQSLTSTVRYGTYPPCMNSRIDSWNVNRISIFKNKIAINSTSKFLTLSHHSFIPYITHTHVRLQRHRWRLNLFCHNLSRPRFLSHPYEIGSLTSDSSNTRSGRLLNNPPTIPTTPANVSRTFGLCLVGEEGCLAMLATAAWKYYRGFDCIFIRKITLSTRTQMAHSHQTL